MSVLQAMPRSAAARPAPPADHLTDALLVCPRCAGRLVRAGADEARSCPGCGAAYPAVPGIVSLLAEEGAGDPAFTRRIRQFYEDNPFPAYDGVADRAALMARATPESFAHTLDRSLPLGSTVVELGCGTGQLTNFLALTGRTALGIDLSLASLSQAEAFRRRQGIDGARFVQMDIFRPAIRPGSVDVVISMGVLHHTKTPARGVMVAASLLKPGGYFVVGLYHSYARLGHRLRQQLFRRWSAAALKLDPVLRRSRAEDRRKAWLFDQYLHPHETCHTSGEVRRWFAEAGLDFIRTVPDYGIARPAFSPDRLLQPGEARHSFDRRVGEALQMFAGNRDGGLFVCVGRKPVLAAGMPRS